MEVDVLTPALGAELKVDLNTIDDNTVNALYDALMKYKVLVLRDQQLTPESHVNLGRAFGELDVPHPVYQNHDTIPEITVLDNDGSRPPDTNDWHKDLTFRPEPPFLSILYALDVPATGGDTLYANMALAYRTLPSGLQSELAGMSAIHDIGTFRNDYLGPERDVAAVDQALLDNGSAVHPVVGVHPVTGEKYLDINRSFTVHIVDMLKTESDRLLQYLYSHIDQPEHQLRIRWQQYTAVFWDNRVTQHYALADYLPARRIMNRVTVTNDKRAAA